MCGFDVPKVLKNIGWGQNWITP